METNIQNEELTPEEAKASLGMATMLQNQLIPKPIEGSESPETAPQGIEQAETENEPVEEEDTDISDLNTKVEELKSSIDEIKNLLTNGTQR